MKIRAGWPLHPTPTTPHEHDAEQGDQANPLGHPRGGAAAARLGVVASRVRQRVTERSLYAVDGPGGRVFPAFQFGPSGALPGLGRVLAAIDPSVHPITVERFFLAPIGDLESDVAGGPLSPRDWLLTSLPVDDVVLLARDL